MSRDRPETPRRPERSFKSRSTSSTDRPSLRTRCPTDCWIQIARSGPHHQTFERREPHRRIHRASPIDRRSGAAIAELQRDEPELGERTVDCCRTDAGQRRMGNAMKSISDGCRVCAPDRDRWHRWLPAAESSGERPYRNTATIGMCDPMTARAPSIPAIDPGLWSGANSVKRSSAATTSSLITTGLEIAHLHAPLGAQPRQRGDLVLQAGSTLPTSASCT